VADVKGRVSRSVVFARVEWLHEAAKLESELFRTTDVKPFTSWVSCTCVEHRQVLSYVIVRNHPEGARSAAQRIAGGVFVCSEGFVA